MVQIYPTTKVCIIGAGAAGPAVATHLSGAGLNVVLLEAGKKFNIDEDYTELPFDMMGLKFNWPFERSVPPVFADDSGNMLVNRFGLLNSCWGVGGTTLMYYGNHPRAHYYSLDQWDEIPNASLPSGNRWRDELEPYYQHLERVLPVPNAPMGFGPFDTHNAVLLVGAKNYQGLVPGDIDALGTPTELPMYNPAQYDPSKYPEGDEPGGYRGQPNNMRKNCWHCGNCQVGCKKPIEAATNKKVKTATNVSFVSDAYLEKTPNLDLRSQSIAVAILRFKKLPDQYLPPELKPYLEHLPHLVVYGRYEFGDDGLPEMTHVTIAGQTMEVPVVKDLHVQPAETVVLSASTTESPKLWLQSNNLLNDAQVSQLLSQVAGQLAQQIGNPSWDQQTQQMFLQLVLGSYVRQGPDGINHTLPPNDSVGRNLMTHYENFITALFDKPLDMWVGQNSQSRVDVPGLGMIESIGTPPMMMASAAFAKDIRFSPNGEPLPDPVFGPNYDFPNYKFGVNAKESVFKKYRYVKILAAFVEDNPLSRNRVLLDPQKKQYIYLEEFMAPLALPVVSIHYSPSEGTLERSRKLTKICIEMMKHVEDTSEVKLVDIYNLNMEQIAAFHSMGTMSMGKVVNHDCQALDTDGTTVDGIFVADASVLPNSLGGPNPVHTIQALSLRTAETIAKKFLSEEEFKKWKGKIGDV